MDVASLHGMVIAKRVILFAPEVYIQADVGLREHEECHQCEHVPALLREPSEVVEQHGRVRVYCDNDQHTKESERGRVGRWAQPLE